jgi:hypothetical protein
MGMYRLPDPDNAQDGDQQSAAETARHARPSKEEVRCWLRRVIAARTPPPPIAEIQRDLWQRLRPD